MPRLSRIGYNPNRESLTLLQTLTLTRNQLTGDIPPELGKLTKLQYLILNKNQLRGRIPSGFGNLTDLLWLYLDDNQLTGTIPSSMGNLIQLQLLLLNNNGLMGPFPKELMNLTNLKNNECDFRNNHLYTRDEALRAFLNAKQIDGDWETSQTPPFTQGVPGIPLLLLSE